MLLEHTPGHGIKFVYIQTDSAGGHGGGRGSGMQLSLNQINSYANTKTKDKEVSFHSISSPSLFLSTPFHSLPNPQSHLT